MDGNQANSKRRGSASGESEDCPEEGGVRMYAVCGACGETATVGAQGGAICPACDERHQTMRVLWRRWMIFLLLLVIDISLAWSVRGVPLMPW